MSSDTKVTDRLEKTVDILNQTLAAAWLAAATVGLLCLMSFAVAITFAALHKGDDLGDFGGPGNRGGGDVIILPGGPPAFR